MKIRKSIIKNYKNAISKFDKASKLDIKIGFTKPFCEKNKSEIEKILLKL